MDYQYDIFISYRHKPLDGVITQKTFHMLESYRLPRKLRKQGTDIQRVFRDTEELSVSRILTDTIDKALRNARCLMIVCSTDTPSSEWVDREVAMFIELGKAEMVYPLLISGSPETSFPPSLLRIPDIMDRVMDVRSEGNRVRSILRREDTELLKLIAGASGVSYRALLKEHNQRKYSRFIGKAAAAAAVFAGITAVSLGLMNMAQAYRDRAEEAENTSMEILQELTYGLPDKLSGVPGAYGRISSILQENADQINRILLLSTDQTSAGMEVAANYEKLATAMSVLGEYDEAILQQEKAVELYEELCAETGNTAPLASAKNNYAKVLSLSGQYEKAAGMFDEAIALQRQQDDVLTLAAMLSNAEGNAVELNRADAAASYYTECIQLLQGIEENYEVISVRAGAASNLGICYLQQGNYADAETELLQAAADYETLCASVDSPENRNLLLNTISSLALSIADQGRYSEAETFYLQAITIAQELAADADNTDSVSNLASLHNNCGICYNMEADFSAAAEHYASAAELLKGLAEKTGSLPDRIAYAEACMNTGDNCFKMAQYEKTWSAFESGLQAFAAAQSELDNSQQAEYAAWNAYVLLVRDRDTDAALEWALNAYSLQPDSVFVNNVLGYVCLYSGYYDDADALLSLVASLGEGQAQMIRLDLQAQTAAGLASDHLEAVLELIS